MGPARRIDPGRSAWFALAPAVAAWAMAAEPSESAAARNEAAVVARVGDEPIRRGEIERLWRSAVGSRSVERAARPLIEAQLLEEIIARRLVLQYARLAGLVDNAAVDAEIERLGQALAARGRTIEQYLAGEGYDTADLRRRIEWRLVWPKLVQRWAGDERLAAWFDAHRRQFDGTEVLVRQILLRPPTGDRPVGAVAADWAALRERAETIRREIQAGTIDFAEAARRYSHAPSAADGGRLGWIGAEGPMPEAFHRAAVELDPGETSPPIETPLGVHLIHCDELRPGTRRWTDAREALEQAVQRELLTRLADRQRRRTEVVYTGESPHFKPGTRELADP